ncbi:MAG: TonB family protein [Terriglobales bacterium]
MPHALLLSPDDQAVSAITSVLEEMSVSCERPLDGPSAAKKLNSQSFDLVLVDCENLPAAKLIFDVCRRSQTGTNPVPIAIVDGRAGLPTAFRLGAELILTKPVAKDQARTTIRTAVGRVRKEEPARAIHPFEDTPVEIAAPLPEKLTQAAAASAVSSLPKGADIAPPVPSAAPAVARMHSAVDEMTPAPDRSKPHPAPTMEFFTPPSLPAKSKSAPPLKTSPEKPSDDPVLADLESDLPTPVFTSYTQPREKKKGHGLLVALLLLALAVGGFYAAWMYQPGFREMARPQIERLLQAVGTPRPPQDASPSGQAPAPPPTTPEATPPGSTSPPASDAPVNSAPASTAASPAPASTDATAPTLATAAPAPAATPALESAKAPADSKKSVIAAPPSDTELPGEETAVIISSQGAEKRLLRHVQPVYPAEARKERIEGTVVLKAVVSDSGKVEGVRLVEGNPTLAAAAISAVKQWHYRPYIRDGKARPFQTIVLVDFQRR